MNASVPVQKKGVFQFIKRHKILSSVAVIVLAGVIYYSFSSKANSGPARYSVAQAQKGTLILTVSGTGQVASSNQVDIKPKASGAVLSVQVKSGDVVKSGAIIAQLDARDAKKAVRDAQLNLQSAQISLQKLVQPSDALTLINAQNSYAQAQRDLVKLQSPPDEYALLQAQYAVTQAERNLDSAKNNSSKVDLSNRHTLEKTYQDAASAVSKTYINLSSIIKDVHDVHWPPTNLTQTSSQNYLDDYVNIIGKSQSVDDFVTGYDSMYALYNTNFLDYQSKVLSSDQSVQYQLLDKALTTDRNVLQMLQLAKNILDTIATRSDYKKYSIAGVVDMMRPKIDADITTINSDISLIQSAKNTIDSLSQNSPLDAQSSAAAITAAEEQLKEKKASLQQLTDPPKPEDLASAQEKVNSAKASLDKVMEGADPLDVQSQNLTLQQRKNALLDAQNTLSDYTVRAPFDGVLAQVSIQKGDSASSGTAAATIITSQFLAQVSLNEVDAAKVKLNDKATLTFDALSDVSITGKVVQIDTLGTTSQGVVTYGAQIAFDTQNTSIKSGMSVSAEIITEIRQDVLLVPSAAVKSQNSNHFVEVLAGTAQGSAQNGTSTSIITTLNTPQQVSVEIGSSNDSETEVISGLQAGDQVVTQKLTGGTTASSSSSGVRIPGIGGGFSGRPGG